MDKRAQIARTLGEMLNRSGQAFFTAQVMSIENNTCTVDYDGLHISDVRLTPTTTEKQDAILLTPAIGSFVLVATLSGDLNNLCIISMDTIESLKITIGEISVFVDKQGAVFNGGSLGGFVKLGDLVKKINNMESQLNTLKNVLKAWVPVPTDGGSALKGVISTWAGQPITLTKTSDLENEKVKQ
jgi:hypothetical protein